MSASGAFGLGSSEANGTDSRAVTSETQWSATESLCCDDLSTTCVVEVVSVRPWQLVAPADAVRGLHACQQG